MQILVNPIDRQQSKQRIRLLVVLVLLGAVVGGVIFWERARVIADQSQRLQSLARMADENLARQLEALNLALAGVRDDLPFFAAGMFQEALSRRLSALSAALPGVRTLLVVDDSGEVIASNRAQAIGQNVSQRAYFQQLKLSANPDTLYLSEPFTTTSKVFSLNAVKVVPNASGSFRALIAATLDPEHFGVLLHSLLDAADMRATVVHGDGKVFMSMPTNLPTLGMNLAVPGSNFTIHREGGAKESVSTASTYPLGERRLTVWRSIQPSAAHLDKPLVLALGRNLDAALVPWRQTAMLYVALYVLACAIALLAQHVLLRRQKASVVQEQLRSEAVRKSAERVDLALEGAALGLWDVDLTTNVTSVNARYHEMLGYETAQGFGTLDDLIDKIHPDDLETVLEAFAQAQQNTHGVFNMELRMRHWDGHWVWIHSIGRVTERDADGRARRATGTHLDISDRKATEAQIWDMAFYDPLTRLPNRRLLLDRISLARTASERTGKVAALMFLDLDHFKELNDNHGHAAGDELLRQVSVRLTNCVRQSDTVARLGGDEFVLVLHDLDSDQVSAGKQAQAVAHKALLAMQVPFELEKTVHALSASIGVVLFKGRECSVEDILDQADQAMFRAKRSGRNFVEICDAAQARLM